MLNHKISDINWLKRVLIDSWSELSQEDTLTWVISQLLNRRLVMVIITKDAHAEFRLDKLCAQIIVAVTFTAFST